MKPTAEQIKPVEEWLREALPAPVVVSGEQFSRELIWFRANEEKPGTPRYRLEISYEAFEDHSSDALVSTLKRVKAAETMRANPETVYFLDRRLSFGVSKYAVQGSR